MVQDGSVSGWLHQLQQGNEGESQQQIWNRYFEQLVSVARSRLSTDLCRMEDEEDAVLSAFDSFFVRVKDGQFPELKDRTSLWPLLVTITVRKTHNLRRRQRAQKRDTRRQVSGQMSSGGDGDWLNQLAHQQPTPELTVEAIEEANRLLNRLNRDSLKDVARWKLEGYSNAEIAQKAGVMERSIERRLALIRSLWTEAAEGEDSGAS